MISERGCARGWLCQDRGQSVYLSVITSSVCETWSLPICDCVCVLLRAYVRLQGEGAWVSEWGGPPTCVCSPGAAPWGKRGWKMFHTLLRGMALYFLKVRRERSSPS